MTSKTDYAENAITDTFFRGQSVTVGANKLCWCAAATAVTVPSFYMGLLNVALRTNSTVVTTGTFIVLADTNSVLHLLKCTTGGTTASSAPLASVTNNATTTDGTVIWTDQYAACEAGVAANLPPEFSGGSYARAAMTFSLVGMAGTQAAASTTVSSGTGATTSNNTTLTFTNMPIGNAGMAIMFDALSGGNAWRYLFLTGAPVPIAAGASVTFAPGTLSFQEDN